MLKVIKRKVISWFFKPDRDGWYVDQREKSTRILFRIEFGMFLAKKMAVYKVIKGQLTSYKYATGFIHQR